MNPALMDFFLAEYFDEKKKERALLKLDLSECIFKSYTAAQRVERGKANKPFSDFKRWREELIKEAIDNYDKIKQLQIKKEGEKTWADLKSKKRIKF